MEPKDLFVEVRGLELHLAQWGDGARTVLLLHGYQDHARLFDKLAARLVEPGLRLLALDFRGHGDSEHAGAGAAYHFPDYAADLHGIIGAVAGDGPVAIAGHSMGAAVACFYTGAFPERVARLCLIEALGPLHVSADIGPERLRGFTTDVLRLADRPGRRHPSVESAAARVLEKHPAIHPDDALHYARHGTRPVDDALVWKFDPRLHARPPLPFIDELVMPFLARIACPVLVVEGGNGLRLDPVTRARRLAGLAHVETLLVPGAGHHVHLDAPDEVAARLRGFLR